MGKALASLSSFSQAATTCNWKGDWGIGELRWVGGGGIGARRKVYFEFVLVSLRSISQANGNKKGGAL